MVNKKIIERLKKNMRYKDTREVSRRSGFSTVTVSNFFNGKSDKMAENTQSAILTAAAEVIQERKERELQTNMKISALLT
jgi:DNA-binding LacI/PurR family transcriptional regulator